MLHKILFTLLITGAFGLMTLIPTTPVAADGGTSYFPQNVGDEHTYRKTGKLAANNPGWTDKVTDKQGKAFVHSNYFGDNVARTVRTNKKGFIVEKGKEGKKGVWYKFDVSEEWIMNLAQEGVPCVDGSKVKIASRTETVTVPAGTFNNCIKLTFDNNCNDAGITEQWFAPEVGLVKQIEDSFGGPITSELTSAKVGNATYPKQ